MMGAKMISCGHCGEPLDTHVVAGGCPREQPSIPFLPGDALMWQCCWRRGVSCEAMHVAGDIRDMVIAGWDLVRCEDGEDRPFCPEHAPLVREGETQP